MTLLPMTNASTAPPFAAIRRGSARSLAVAIAASVSLLLASCGTSDDDEAAVKFCAVAEGSGSTAKDWVRTAYSSAFDADVDWFAAQGGDQPLCFILATGAGVTNQIVDLPIHPLDPNSTDADDELSTNVTTAKSQFAQVLAVAKDNLGTPLVESLYALGTRADLRKGDTISVYSDMRQDSSNVKAFELARQGNPGAQTAAIDKKLDELAAGGLLPGDGSPGTLAGVHLVVPAPGASKTDAPDPEKEAARAVAVREFWERWADRLDVDLQWAKPASGGRASR